MRVSSVCEKLFKDEITDFDRFLKNLYIVNFEVKKKHDRKVI